MKRVREDDKWKEPGYLGYMNSFWNELQEEVLLRKTKKRAYYICDLSRDVIRQTISICYQMLNVKYASFSNWNDAVAFALKLQVEENVSPLRLQDSVKFYFIYIEIKQAIHTWTLCARRLGLPRDVRQLISEILYNRPWEW